ncbi:MAG: TetR/AcrR family transcriptional regulator [Gemmiger sp.]|nr:TetR/AcrR family transcriptional regulator [Gemmiger sp.]
MARSFNGQEKEAIQKNLLDACKQSWTQFGYKKTSVDALCKQVGISKGAFYLFFESKEALFCDVLCAVQKEICGAASAIIEKRKDKYGVAEALKSVYRAYDSNNFLYQADSMDYTVLMRKLSPAQAKRIEASSKMSRHLFLSQPYLALKVDEDLAISVIYALIMNVKNKDVLPRNATETFDFMVDHLMDSLYV